MTLRTLRKGLRAISLMFPPPKVFIRTSSMRRLLFLLLGRGTDWLQVFPQATKSAAHTVQALKQFAGNDNIKTFRADGASEITAAARERGWLCDTSALFVHQPNGFAERAVRKVRDGGRCNLEQSGLRPSWWSWACMHYCALHNDKGGAFALHYGGDAKWLRVLFGATVDYMPTPDKHPAAFEPRCCPGLFIVYHQHAGGKWSGDYYIADWDGLRQNPDADPRLVRVHRMVEVIPVGRLDDLSSPLAEHRRRQRTVDFVPADPDVEEMFAPDEDGVPLDESGAGVLEGLQTLAIPWLD